MKSFIYNSLNIGRTAVVKSLIFCLLILMGSFYEGYSAVITVYPQTQTRWTGSVISNGTISTSSVMYTQGGPNSRAWMKFDLSGVPQNATISNVVLKYFITSMYNPSLQFRKVTNDPVTMAGTTLWTQIGSGTIYFTATLNSLGWNSRILNTSAKTDIQTAVSGSGNGWVAMGMYCTDNNSYFNAYADGWNQTNKPYLEITYTSTLSDDISLDSISSPKNFACEGSWPVKLKITNAGVNVINNVLITWSINSVTQTPITHTFSPPLAVSGVNSMAYVTLTNFTFNPGNFIISASLANPNGNSDPFTANNSKTVLLQITPKPSIYIQPTDQSIGVGGDAVFNTVASGGSITYQWQVSTNGGTTFTNLTNIGPYTNVTSQSMNITAATQTMNGYLFRCVVSGACPPPALTDTVMLSVGPPISVKAGHAYACPGGTAVLPITVKDAISALGMKLTLTYTTGNVLYNGLAYTNPILNGSFTVTPTAGKVTIQWTGTTPINLPNDTICKLNFVYTTNSTVIFDTLTSGNCKVNGSGGAIFPSHYYNGSVATAAPSIITQPANILAITGTVVNFTVVASGIPTYQWQVSTNNGTTWTNLLANSMYSGVTSSILVITGPTLSMNGYRYKCILNGCSVTVPSNAAIMSVMKLVKTWMDTTYSCTCYTPSLDILVPIKVANFDSINSISLSIFYKETALQYNGYQDVNSALQLPMIYNTNLPGPNSMIRIASFATTGFMAIPDNGVLVNLKFKVLCDTTKLQWETWTPGACQYSTGPDTAIYVFDAQFINGYVLDGGPMISTSPVNQTIFAGDTAFFSCTANTHGAISYQWQESTNGGTTWANIASNNSTYNGIYTYQLRVISMTTGMNGYKYRCLVHGMCDDQTTNSATLTVNAPPIYVTIPPIVSCEGDLITVPVNVENFAGACSFNLTLQFDNTKMTFSDFTNLNANLSSPGSFTATLSGLNKVILAWSGTTSTIPGIAALVQVRFTTTQLFSLSPITWVTTPITSSQIKNCAAPQVPINTVFSNSTVSVNPIPVVHNVITPFPAGGHFCAGGAGVQIGVDITQTGVNYALYRDNSILQTYSGVAGTGFGITFNTFNIPGAYTVRAYYPVTLCSVAMDGTVNVVADAPPTAYTVTGTGSYCTGGTGIPVGLSNSQLSVDYFLYFGTDPFPIDTLIGTASALNFGNQLTAGTYTIVARNAFYETCPTTMTGSAVITINPYPDAAGTITGPATNPCQGGTAQYCVPAIANATSYFWTLPSGCTPVSGVNTNCITVSFSNTAVSGTISVKGNNPCGDGAPSSFSITVSPLPGAAGTITGPNPVCQGTTAQIYSVPSIANATTYTWTFPNGIVVTNNGSSASVNVGLLAASGTVTVTGVNSCGVGTSSTMALVVNPMPGNALSITGTTSPCQGATITYSTPPIANAANYNWVLPAGATGTSTTNSITVTFAANATSGNITVTGNNGCGNGGTFTLALNVQPLPGAGTTITGPSEVCKGSSYTYTIPAITGAITYIWSAPAGFTGSSTSNSITYLIGNTAISGNITVKGHNNCGDGVSATKAITVYDLPVPTQTPFPTICKDGGNYTLTGGSPTGGSYSGTGVTAGVFNPVTAGVGTFTITYTYTLTPVGCVGTTTQPITVVDKPKISGTLTYDNTALTELGYINVDLKDAGNTTILNSMLTTSVLPFGNYNFNCLTASTNYNLACSIPVDHPRPWPVGPVNGTDALLIMQHAVQMITLPPFRAKCADVNGNNAINSVDAMLVMKRFVGQITSFPAGDWVFNTYAFNPVVVGTTSVTQPILALVYGDVNASFLPSNIKKSPTVFLGQVGTTTINELETKDIQFTLNEPISMASASIALDYSSNNLEILGVTSPLEGFLYNVIDGQLRIVWYDLKNLNLRKGDVLFTVKVRVKNGVNANDDLNFSIDANSEITALDAISIENVILNSPKITLNTENTFSNTKDFKLGANQPNPFSDITEISYYLPENGFVHLSVMNLLGEEVKVIVNEQQTAGNFKVKFEANGLTPGMYLYKLELKGMNQHYLQSRSMIVME